VLVLLCLDIYKCDNENNNSNNNNNSIAIISEKNEQNETDNIPDVQLDGPDNDPFNFLASEVIKSIFNTAEDSNQVHSENRIFTDHQNHHTTTVRESHGPGVSTVIITDVMDGNPGSGMHIEFSTKKKKKNKNKKKKINLKNKKKGESPFKVFQDIDDIFEGFLNGFMQMNELGDQADSNMIKVINLDNSDQENNGSIEIKEVRDITKEINELEVNEDNRGNKEENKIIQNDENIVKDEKKNKKYNKSIEDKANKNSSFFTKFLKYGFYVIFAGLVGLFIKIILNKYNINQATSNDNVNENSIEKNKVEVKGKKEEKNKLF